MVTVVNRAPVPRNDLEWAEFEDQAARDWRANGRFEAANTAANLAHAIRCGMISLTSNENILHWLERLEMLTGAGSVDAAAGRPATPNRERPEW